MIALGAADLVVIACRTLDLDTEAALDLFDPEAAERALSDALAAGAGGDDGADDPAGRAAALLDALLRQRPFRRGNQRVALVAMLQFLALNGWEVDPDSPAATMTVVAELAAGTVEAGAVKAWLAPRLRCGNREATDAKEAPMRRWLPVRKRRAGRTGMFERFSDRARQAVQLAQDEARRLGHSYIGTEHLLLGLLCEDQGVAAKALVSLGISLEAVRGQVEEIIGRGRGRGRAGAYHVGQRP
jgi:prophage maintenance system killer protein